MTDGVFTLGEEGWASVTPIGKPRRSMGVSNDDGNRQDCL